MNQNARFAKSTLCPVNEKLLACQRQELDAKETDEILCHLEQCEFCALLFDLLEFHPGEIPSLSEIPPIPDDFRKSLRRYFPLRTRRSC